MPAPSKEHGLFDGARSKGLFVHGRDTLFAHDLARLEVSTADTLERVLQAQMQRYYDTLLNHAYTRC